MITLEVSKEYNSSKKKITSEVRKTYFRSKKKKSNTPEARKESE